MLKYLNLLTFLLVATTGLSQGPPEKISLRQTFIDSMHTQTREHIIIDSISEYYNLCDYTTLNQAQKDLIFIYNFQDTLYSYDFADLFINHSDIILVEAYEVFQRVKCRSTQAKIEEFRAFSQEYTAYIEKGVIPDVLNEDSPHYDPDEESRLYQTLFTLELWITMLPREKVLSIYYYIIDNKEFLYK